MQTQDPRQCMSNKGQNYLQCTNGLWKFHKPPRYITVGAHMLRQKGALGPGKCKIYFLTNHSLAFHQYFYTETPLLHKVKLRNLTVEL